MHVSMVLMASIIAAELSLEDIVKAHRTTIESLHEMELVVDHYMSNPLARDPRQLVLNTSYHFWFDAQRARSIIKAAAERTSGLGVPGEHPGYRDSLVAANEMRVVAGFDPDDPPRLGEYSTSRAHGYIRRPPSIDRFKYIEDPYFYLNQKVSHIIERMFLWDLIARSGKATNAGESKAADGRVLRLLLIEFEGYSYKVFLDPENGFLVHRVEITPGPKAKIQASSFREVTSYQDVAGLRLPRDIQGAYSERGHESLVKTVCQVVSCNRPLADDSFHVVFPAWLPVDDEIRRKFYIWGKDDKPALTFDTFESFESWWQPRYERAVRNATKGNLGVTWPTILLASAAAIALILSLRPWRWKRT